jgi:hypothetical protein
MVEDDHALGEIIPWGVVDVRYLLIFRKKIWGRKELYVTFT